MLHTCAPDSMTLYLLSKPLFMAVKLYTSLLMIFNRQRHMICKFGICLLN